MLIPYLDLLLAVFRRTRAGQSPFAADKKHLQHRLLAIGHSHRTSVLIMYLWATLFAGTVVLLSIIRTKLPVLGVVTLAGFLVLLWLTMPRLRPWGRHGGSRPVPAVASPVPGGRQAGPVPANRGPVNPVPANQGPANPVPANPVPTGAGQPSAGPPRSGPPHADQPRAVEPGAVKLCAGQPGARTTRAWAAGVGPAGHRRCPHRPGW